MKPKEKKGNRIKYVLFSVLFLVIIVTAVLIAVSRQPKSEGTYQEMDRPSLPTVTVSFLDRYSMKLYGYVNEMTLVDMRDVILPVG
ncbi:MAG: hypothetical protein IK088_06160, partial [Lachnospiraceae bacterium]|nr:hypothetical protein [Lachnospiraceae bacterium]